MPKIGADLHRPYRWDRKSHVLVKERDNSLATSALHTPLNVVCTEIELHRLFMIQPPISPNTGVSWCRGAPTIDYDSCHTFLPGNCHLSPTLFSRGFGKPGNMLSLLVNLRLLNCRDATNINSSNWEFMRADK